MSYLIYADLVLIFSNTNAKSLKAIKEVLGIFSQFSRLVVNEDKCSAFYSKSALDLHHIHEVLGFPVKNSPHLSCDLNFRKV